MKSSIHILNHKFGQCAQNRGYCHQQSLVLKIETMSASEADKESPSALVTLGTMATILLHSVKKAGQIKPARIKSPLSSLKIEVESEKKGEV